MKKYLIRLDDASEYMNTDCWNRMEALLDKYQICPVVGIIPDNRDEILTTVYKQEGKFWETTKKWMSKGWIPALHGCEHKYITKEGGLNPINRRSEFAGLPYEFQAEKIEKGWNILKSHGIVPEVFFAPSHTFDENTLLALRNKTEIRVISDTIAFDIYKIKDFWFIPQQSGKVRKLPFRFVTFCYHPNTMDDESFCKLEEFIEKNRKSFVQYDKEILKNREFSILDHLLRRLYFMRKKFNIV